MSGNTSPPSRAGATTPAAHFKRTHAKQVTIGLPLRLTIDEFVSGDAVRRLKRHLDLTAASVKGLHIDYCDQQMAVTATRLVSRRQHAMAYSTIQHGGTRKGEGDTVGGGGTVSKRRTQHQFATQREKASLGPARVQGVSCLSTEGADTHAQTRSGANGQAGGGTQKIDAEIIPSDERGDSRHYAPGSHFAGQKHLQCSDVLEKSQQQDEGQQSREAPLMSRKRAEYYRYSMKMKDLKDLKQRGDKAPTERSKQISDISDGIKSNLYYIDRDAQIGEEDAQNESNADNKQPLLRRPHTATEGASARAHSAVTQSRLIAHKNNYYFNAKQNQMIGGGIDFHQIGGWEFEEDGPSPKLEEVWLNHPAQHAQVRGSKQ